MSWLTYHLVLAQTSRLRAMGSGVRGNRARMDGQEILIWLLVLAIIVAAVYVLYKYAESQGPSRSFYRRRSLLGSLAKAHGLDWRTRRLLKRLARAHRLRYAGELFLRPDCFDTIRLGAKLAPFANEIESLRERLFGGEAVAETRRGALKKKAAKNRRKAKGPAIDGKKSPGEQAGTQPAGTQPDATKSAIPPSGAVPLDLDPGATNTSSDAPAP